MSNEELTELKSDKPLDNQDPSLYDDTKLIINWDKNPEKELLEDEKPAQQKIFSNKSHLLADFDYYVYTGKIIESFYYDNMNRLVIVLKTPTEEDLKPENARRVPKISFSKPENHIANEPESIIKQTIDPLTARRSAEHLEKMRQFYFKDR